MRLLLTRPEADAARTADALRTLGHDPVIAPLLQIEPVSDASIGAGPWAAILTTSANAAHAIARHVRLNDLRTVPVYAAGDRSAEAMRAIGFAEVQSAGGSVSDLARLVAARITPGAALLYLAASERAGDLAGDLRTRGFAVETAVVYRAVAAAVLSLAATDALAQGLHGVLHFSRRSAETYLAAAGQTGALPAALRPVHYCLSVQVAEPLSKAGAPDVRVAPHPTEAALIALIG